MRTRHGTRFIRLTLAVGLLPLGAAAQAPARNVVAGSVRGADDARLAGAIVELRDPSGGAARRASTDADGAFRFGDVAPGSVELRVWRVGFRPETLQVEVPQVDGGAVIVPLERVAQAMASVVVHAQSHANVAITPFSAFERRRAAGLGHFVTRADIDKRRPQRTSDILRAVPGVVLVQGDAGTLVPQFRNSMSAGSVMRGGGGGQGTCAPFYWMDGSPLGALALDLDAIPTGAVEGIEVYSGIATVPAALRGGVSNAVCGVIVVWTRRGGPRTGVGSVSSSELAKLVESGDVFTADQVDEAATLLPAVPFSPEYPEALRKTPGRVVAEFVVAPSGEIEGETIGFVSSTAPAFTESVRAALYGLQFSPAQKKGKGVRQVVQWPVRFEPDEKGTAVVKTP